MQDRHLRYREAQGRTAEIRSDALWAPRYLEVIKASISKHAALCDGTDQD